MSKKLLWIVPTLIVVLILVYGGVKYPQYSAEWKEFDAAQKKIDQLLPGGSKYHWKPGLFSAVGELNLSGREITNKQPAVIVTNLSRVSTLVKLDLSNNAITDAGADRLGTLVHLQQLNLQGTKVTDAGVKTLKTNLPNCEISR